MVKERRGKWAILWVVPLVVMLSAGRGRACTDIEGYNLSVCADLFVNGYFRLTPMFGTVNRTLWSYQKQAFYTIHADNLEFQRNELALTVDGLPKAISDWLGFNVRYHVRIEPWYDSTYDFTGIGQGSFHRPLADQLSNNLNGRLGEFWDPLFREYYFDLSPPHFSIRIGRQIVAWGKSDGFYILDIINNFNLVNPEIFNEQDVKIPNWMVNINWMATPSGTLQLLLIPVYIPTYYPGYQVAGGYPIQGGYGDFTYGVVKYFNNFYNGSFGFKVPVVKMQMPSPGKLDDWTYGARWSDRYHAFHYTLNFLYTYTTTVIQYPNTGNFATATTANFHPHRMYMGGGSADYEFNTGNPWFDGTVLRGESAVLNGDQFYEGIEGNPQGVTHWSTLVALDRYILTDYLERPIFFSVQYYQDWVMARNGTNPQPGPGASEYEWYGYQGGHSGLRASYYDSSTMYLYKTFMQGDILAAQFAAVYEWQFQDMWFQPSLSYRYNDKTTFVVGFNIFAGSRQTPYGEFTDNSNIYFELHKVIF
jgi:hypothetical protein